MSVVVILAAIWAWALLPPLLARARTPDDPVDAFARFQARDHRLSPAAVHGFDPTRRRAQVLGTLLAADAALAAAWVVLDHRWLLGAAAAGVDLTVGWYGLAVRRRLATRRAHVPARAAALPGRLPGLATAA